jgi:MFS family permease
MALSIAILRNFDFRRLLGARVFAMFGLQAQAVIVGWQLYTLTHNVLMLGLIGLTEAVPAIIGALFAGHMVDIGRPHRIYLASIATLALANLLLFLVAGGIVPFSEVVQIRVIFVCVFFSGLSSCFLIPASFTLLSRIAPRHDIPAASAWLSSGFQFAAIVGPALAGIIYGGYGHAVAWAIPVVSLSLALIMAATISKPHRQFRNTNHREPVIASIKAGWQFVLRDRTLLSTMSLDMLAVLFGGAVAILPAFADSVLHIGSEGLGLLRAAPAIGSIVTALFLALKPMKKIHARTMLIVVAGFGICMIGFGLSRSFWLAGTFLLLSGAFDSVSMVIRGTLVQLLTPETMRGRVSALNSMFIISSNQIGAFESGAAASLLGLVPSIVIGGAMTLVVVAGAALVAPSLRRLVIETGETRT